MELSRSEKIIQLWKSNRKKIGGSLGLILFVIFTVFKVTLTEDVIKNHADVLRTLSFAVPVLAAIAGAIIVLVSFPMWIWEKVVNKKRTMAELLAKITELEKQVSELKEYESFTIKLKKMVLTAQLEQQLGGRDSDKLSINAITKLMENEIGEHLDIPLTVEDMRN